MSKKKKKREEKKDFSSRFHFVVLIITLIILLVVTFIYFEELKHFEEPISIEDGEKIETKDSFISVWKTDKLGESGKDEIKLPLTPTGSYNFTVDWGDGNTDKITSLSKARHTYEEPGRYKINITGKIQGWSFDNKGDKNKLLEIKQWGPLRFGNTGGYFHGAKNLKITAEDMPCLEGTTDLTNMFARTNLQKIPNINKWDVSNVKKMNSMFSYAIQFNNDLNGWDISNVKDMSFMFFRATSFNKPIDKWDTSNVESMRAMFNGALFFNQDINNWDVSKVNDMAHMFDKAGSFNKTLNEWDTSNVENMKGMFFTAESFDQDLDNWDTSNVKSMGSMFVDAISFNGDITTWNTDNVEDMNFMFRRATSFNQDISGWDTSNVEICSGFAERANDFKDEFKPEFENC
ncbi:MAG: BspA family leucine-rich repeat surface protein [Candidatus Nanoarchaeia archaeon]